MLPESKKEQVKEPPEPMQQALLVKASQEAVDVGQLLRTTRVAMSWKKLCAVLQIYYQTKIYGKYPCL